MLVESIMRIVAIVALAIPRSFLKFIVFFLYCIVLRFFFHLKHVNNTYFINMRS